MFNFVSLIIGIVALDLRAGRLHSAARLGELADHSARDHRRGSRDDLAGHRGQEPQPVRHPDRRDPPDAGRRDPMSREPRIDAYIAKAQPFARPILEKVRERVHAVVPDVEEAMKWSHPDLLQRRQDRPWHRRLQSPCGRQFLARPGARVRHSRTARWANSASSPASTTCPRRSRRDDRQGGAASAALPPRERPSTRPSPRPNCIPNSRPR